ncbi:HAD-IC family P-type ATPase [Variovorax guangxiensis]|uniref:cation-translocating P-type ATPase n=1 Tax=Variovorax guangxiensis TaxID=1775474 RepID=UPI002855FE7D|nr:HAD-IC family P-type ATPase [Variovorax guangxiensis]MDR6858553.1 Ca2+-transporting ATPase [Variovorax guangxiensis]
MTPNPDETAWHSLDAADVASRLGVAPERGLDSSEAAKRAARWGPNALIEAPRPVMWRSFVRQLRSPLIGILFAAAVLAVALGEFGDATVIIAVVVVNAVIGTLQEGRAERSMAALRKLAELQVRVLRDGVESILAARDLVLGDVVLLAAGDAVAADARLLEATRFQVAEAALTGESVPVSKSTAALSEATALPERDCMVYSGTHVTAGRARSLVVAIGASTEVGRLAGLTEGAVDPPTPLEQRVRRFGRWLVGAALVLFVAVVALGMLRELSLSEILMVAISQMVSMVPEGLPVAMTIALAVGMRRMAERGAIIRRLSAVETLGSTTVICTDKTGTLTRNEMTVCTLWLPDARVVDVSGIGYAPHGELRMAGGVAIDADDAPLRELLCAAVLCNDAKMLLPNKEGAGWSVLGDPTEGALLVLATKAGIDLETLRSAAPREAELPFDPDTKMMATRHRFNADEEVRRVFIKGAPEAVLRLCAGSAQPAARTAADAMAARALRVLAFAELDDDSLDPLTTFSALTGRARLLGLIGQIDPPRDEAKAAVAQCRAAGIRPIMITGDHKLTALAIAREVGIAGRNDDRLAIDGAELERMGEGELRARVAEIAVFARVQPAQKLRIVEALQSRGETVAMTGDGINDAPALARADVGVAMGIAGTEVAKNAAKIVITDDNFATIVSAVEQGRVVYSNLKKVILFLFATSVDEVAILLLALLGGFPLPLAAVQILWINIVTEGVLTVNLVMEAPDGDEMQRAPVPRDDHLLDREMLIRVMLMAGAAAAVGFGWFAWRLASGTEVDVARTETFTLVVLCQWFNVLNCRSATRSALGVLPNPWLIGGLLLGAVLQAAVLYAPFLNEMFHTQPIPPIQLLSIIAAASIVLWIEEARKAFVRWLTRRRLALAGAVR